MRRLLWRIVCEFYEHRPGRTELRANTLRLCHCARCGQGLMLCDQMPDTCISLSRTGWLEVREELLVMKSIYRSLP